MIMMRRSLSEESVQEETPITLQSHKDKQQYITIDGTFHLKTSMRQSF